MCRTMQGFEMPRMMFAMAESNLLLRGPLRSLVFGGRYVFFLGGTGGYKLS
jgi:hypothetical protein